MFRYQGCIFSNSKSKDKTARVVFFKEFGIERSYTLECSFFGYRNFLRETMSFSENDIKKMGRILAKSIYDYGLYEDVKI